LLFHNSKKEQAMKINPLKIQAALVVAGTVAFAAVALALTKLVSTYFTTETLFMVYMAGTVGFVLYCFYRMVLIQLELREKVSKNPTK
jgi:hypothetical protein